MSSPRSSRRRRRRNVDADGRVTQKDGGKAATRTFTYYVNVNFDESQPHGQLTAADGACADLPESFLNAVSSVKYDGTGPCTLYSYVDSRTATERRIV